MGFAVFIHREDSPYADSPATHYQFPKPYLSRVARRSATGSSISSHQGSDTRGYYAIARVERVIADPRPDMYRR